MNVLAIPATASENGINQRLLTYAAGRMQSGLVPGAVVEIIDLNHYEMPIYTPKREQEDGIPDLAHQLRDKIGQADALIISFAEYNGSYTAAWKNIFDWMSRIDRSVYQNRKVIMLAATPGPRGGAGVLGSATMSAPFFDADMVGSLGVGSFGQNFDDETGELTDPDLVEQLEKLLVALAD